MKTNAAQETIKARAAVTLPELLIACFELGKQSITDYTESKTRIQLLEQGIEEAEQQIMGGLQLMKRLVVFQKESLENDARRATKAGHQFMDLAQTCREFMELGNYEGFQKAKAGNRLNPVKQGETGSKPGKVVNIRKCAAAGAR